MLGGGLSLTNVSCLSLQLLFPFLPRACIALGRGLVRDLGTSPLPLPRNWRLGTQRVCRRQPLSTPELVTAKLCSTSEYLHSLPGRGMDREQREDRHIQTDTHRAEKDREGERQAGREEEGEREKRQRERDGETETERARATENGWRREKGRETDRDRNTERKRDREL